MSRPCFTNTQAQVLTIRESPHRFHIHIILGTLISTRYSFTIDSISTADTEDTCIYLF